MDINCRSTKLTTKPTAIKLAQLLYYRLNVYPELRLITCKKGELKSIRLSFLVF